MKNNSYAVFQYGGCRRIFMFDVPNEQLNAVLARFNKRRRLLEEVRRVDENKKLTNEQERMWDMLSREAARPNLNAGIHYAPYIPLYVTQEATTIVTVTA